MELKVVTGYIPIQGFHRTAKDFGELGENLFGKLDFNGSIHPYYETVPETWLMKLINNQPFDVTHSAGDNPTKNTLAYHAVQHQKFGWLLKALLTDASPDTFVWMDYGIAHVPGVTPEVVNAFLASVKPDDLSIPGCWPKEGLVINDYFPCWRFCGGLMVVPKRHVKALYKGVKYAVMVHMQKQRNVPWEVNTLAEAERDKLVPPIRWYKADHNQTLFTNYGEPHDEQSSSGDSVCPPEGQTPYRGTIHDIRGTPTEGV